jgi:hypothetical protein
MLHGIYVTLLWYHVEMLLLVVYESLSLVLTDCQK